MRPHRRDSRRRAVARLERRRFPTGSAVRYRKPRSDQIRLGAARARATGPPAAQGSIFVSEITVGNNNSFIARTPAPPSRSYTRDDQSTRRRVEPREPAAPVGHQPQHHSAATIERIRDYRQRRRR